MSKNKTEAESHEGIRRVPVVIAGHAISIKTDAEDAFIAGLAREVEARVAALRRGGRTTHETAVILLACLGFANEKATAQADVERLLAENRELSGLIDQARAAIADLELRAADLEGRAEEAEATMRTLRKDLGEATAAARREDEKHKDAEFRCVELRDRLAEVEAEAKKALKRAEADAADTIKALQKELDRLKSELGAEHRRASDAERASVDQSAQAAEMKRRARKSDEQTKRAEELARKAELLRDEAERRMNDLQRRLGESESRSRQIASRLVTLEDKLAKLAAERETEKRRPVAEHPVATPEPARHGELEGRMKEALTRILGRVDIAVEEIARLKQEGL